MMAFCLSSHRKTAGWFLAACAVPIAIVEPGSLLAADDHDATPPLRSEIRFGGRAYAIDHLPDGLDDVADDLYALAFPEIPTGREAQTA